MACRDKCDIYLNSLGRNTPQQKSTRHGRAHTGQNGARVSGAATLYTPPMDSTESPLLRKYAGWIPVCYAGITLLGFINYYTLYRPYGIAISYYLTIGELLLAFLNVTIPLLALIGLFSVMLVLGFAFQGLFDAYHVDAKREAKPTLLQLPAHVKQYRKRWANPQWTSLGWWPWTILQPIYIAFYAGAWLFFIAFLILFLKLALYGQNVMGYEGTSVLIWSLVWLYLFSEAIGHGVREERIQKIWGHGIRWVVASLVCMGTIAGENSLRANRILEGSAQESATIVTSTDTLVTTECLIYAGRIEAGVFLHDISTASNILIPAAEIRSFKLEKD